ASARARDAASGRPGNGHRPPDHDADGPRDPRHDLVPIGETRVNAPPVEIREARTSDVSVIRHLVDEYAADRILLSKATVTLYEDVQEFYVAEVDGAVVGCGALHVLCEDHASESTLAVDV